MPGTKTGLFTTPPQGLSQQSESTQMPMCFLVKTDRAETIC